MNKLENLITKRGFIYLIDGEYYYIGHWIFKKCTDGHVINLFEEYRELDINNLEDEKRILYLFRKLMLYSEFEIEDPNETKYDRNIVNFIEGLSDRNKELLLIQLDDFVNLFMYFNKKYYI